MATIKSRNDLFKGMEFEKPKKALVVGHDEEFGDIYACPNCGSQAHAEDCDVLGAEPGCLFCNQCNREFEAWDE